MDHFIFTLHTSNVLMESNLHIVPVTLRKVTCTKCALIPHDAGNVAVFFYYVLNYTEIN